MSRALCGPRPRGVRPGAGEGRLRASHQLLSPPRQAIFSHCTYSIALGRSAFNGLRPMYRCMSFRPGMCKCCAGRVAGTHSVAKRASLPTQATLSQQLEILSARSCEPRHCRAHHRPARTPHNGPAYRMLRRDNATLPLQKSETYPHF